MLLKSEVEAGVQAVRLEIVYHIHPPYHCLRQVYPHKAPFSTPTARGYISICVIFIPALALLHSGGNAREGGQPECSSVSHAPDVV